MSYFTSINVGLKALQAQRKSLDVTSHNIANANTKGYSRQRAVHKANDPYAYPGMNLPDGAGQVGTGVEIEEIERIRDSFIDNQIQQKKQLQGQWNKRYDGLHQIELIFNEPSDSSLSSALSNFWKSLEDLSTNPENTAVRTTVRDRALTLVDTFHSLHKQLDDYKRSLNENAETTVDDINSIINRIADINDQIVKVQGSGQNPNDLMDKRDLLFEQLNEKVNVNGSKDSRGNLNISLNGINIVTGDDTHTLEVVKTEEQYESKVVFAATGEEALIDSGQLKGIMDTRDLDIENAIDRLDGLAAKLAGKVNAIHEEGYDLEEKSGAKFFTFLDDSGDQSKQILLNNIIREDPDKIAASTTQDGVPGNGDNALKLARALKQDYTITSKRFSETDTALNLNGDFTIGQGENSFQISISTSDTLADIVENINDNQDNIGNDGDRLVTATIIDGKLALESTLTGSSEDISLSEDTDGILEGLGLRKITSAPQESLTEPLDLNSGDPASFEVIFNGNPANNITIDNINPASEGESDSLEDIVEAINNASENDDGSGGKLIKASIEDDALVIESVNADTAITGFNDGDGILEELGVIDDSGNNNYKANRSGNNSSVMSNYQSLISTLGVEGQRAKQMADNQDVLVDQLSNQRQSVSGVSLDEEMANMIKYQQAYAAASKIITTSNKMLDTLMGIIR